MERPSETKTVAEAEAIDALTNLTSSPIPEKQTLQDKHALAHSLFAAVAAAALSGQLQQSNHPDTSSPPSILQIQSGLKTVMDLISTFQSKHAVELLAQIMDALSTHCEVLGLSPDESALTVDEKTEFWKHLNDTWLFAIECANRKDLAGDADTFQEMNEDDWVALRDSVIAWGDVLEWYGLVDYEMGFWEERILNAIHLQIHQWRVLHSGVE